MYFVVDESGQDARARVQRLFVVGVACIEDPDAARALLAKIESESGKEKHKWHGSRHELHKSYINSVLAEPYFKGDLYFRVYSATEDYGQLTLETVADVIKLREPGPRRAIVWLDGLEDSMVDGAGVKLRRLGVNLRKHGLVKTDDQKDSLARLADAVAGFVRDARSGVPDMPELLEKALKNEVICEI